jgi:chromosome segregation ATPase
MLTRPRCQRELNATQGDMRARQARFQDEQRDLVNQISEHKAEIDHAQRALERLNSVEHQKLEHVRKWDRDVADTVEWLRGNQHRFQMEVMEPACITLRVKDARFADAVEACFGGRQIRVRWRAERARGRRG